MANSTQSKQSKQLEDKHHLQLRLIAQYFSEFGLLDNKVIDKPLDQESSRSIECQTIE